MLTRPIALLSVICGKRRYDDRLAGVIGPGRLHHWQEVDGAHATATKSRTSPAEKVYDVSARVCPHTRWSFGDPYKTRRMRDEDALLASCLRFVHTHTASRQHGVEGTNTEQDNDVTDLARRHGALCTVEKGGPDVRRYSVHRVPTFPSLPCLG
jgi:hypothetical protein